MNDDDLLGVKVYRPWQRVRRSRQASRRHDRCDRGAYDAEHERRVLAQAERVAREDPETAHPQRRKQHWWTEAELELLRREAVTAPSQNELARRMAPVLGRSVAALRNAIQAYGIRTGGMRRRRDCRLRPWNPGELAILREELSRSVPALEVARCVSRRTRRRVLDVLGMMEAHGQG